VHVVVIGGGLMGTTTAYYLLELGHRVTLIDRCDELAAEGSHANAGILHAGHAEPWNTWAAVGQLARSLVRPDGALRLKPKCLPSLTAWGTRFLWHCRRSSHDAVTEANTRLAAWSLELTEELRRASGIAFDGAQHGSLRIFRDHGSFEAARATATAVERLGVRSSVLDADAAVEREPALADIRGELVGALHYRDDAQGDAARFTRGLGEIIRRAGAELRLGETVRHLEGSASGGVTGVVTNAGVLRGDRFVLANGVDAPALARPLGVRLPIEPVKGYSATVTLDPSAPAPRMPIIDDDRQVVMGRLGERLRFTGMAELAGFDRSIRPQLIEHIISEGLADFPRLASHIDRTAAQHWACLRPVSADGAPLIGATGVANLFVNAGAGHLGWTFAAGAGRLAAEAVAQHAPTLSLPRTSARRFNR